MILAKFHQLPEVHFLGASWLDNVACYLWCLCSSQFFFASERRKPKHFLYASEKRNYLQGSSWQQYVNIIPPIVPCHLLSESAVLCGLLYLSWRCLFPQKKKKCLTLPSPFLKVLLVVPVTSLLPWRSFGPNYSDPASSGPLESSATPSPAWDPKRLPPPQPLAFLKRG